MNKPDALPLRREPRRKPRIEQDDHVNKRLEQFRHMGFEPGASWETHTDGNGVTKVIWTLTERPPF